MNNHEVKAQVRLRFQAKQQVIPALHQRTLNPLVGVEIVPFRPPTPQFLDGAKVAFVRPPALPPGGAYLYNALDRC